jgi:hypothetical protein
MIFYVFFVCQVSLLSGHCRIVYNKEFVLAERDCPLPSAYGREYLGPWAFMPARSVFAYLGTMHHATQSNEVI